MGPPPPCPPLRTAEEEEESSERDEREQEVSKQRGVVALVLPLAHADVHSVGREDVDELRVVGEDDVRASSVDGGELQLRSVLGESHAFHLARLHGVDELAVSPLVSLGEVRT